MTMQVFNNCPETECYWENDDEAFDNFRLRDRKAIAALIASSRAKTVVFKPITESQHAAAILENHDGARALWVYRHYDDVVNSALRNFREHRKYLAYMLHEPDIAKWRIEGVPIWILDLVREYYEADISDASAQALIWWIRNQHFFQQNLGSRSDVMLVKYEDLVQEPVAAFEDVFRFADLHFEARFARSIFKTSVAKQRPPELDGSIRDLCESMLNALDLAGRKRAAAQSVKSQVIAKLVR